MEARTSQGNVLGRRGQGDDLMDCDECGRATNDAFLCECGKLVCQWCVDDHVCTAEEEYIEKHTYPVRG